MSKDQIASFANEIFEIVQELPGPKDAATALLIAHVMLTHLEGDGFDVEFMLEEYRTLFRKAYSENRPS